MFVDFWGWMRIFPVGCRCVLVYLGRWSNALCFAWWSPASERLPSGTVFICHRVYLSDGRVLYVFGESWIGVGLGVRWVVCTVNCGCTHYYTVLMLILRITVYYRVMPSVVHAVMVQEPHSALHDSTWQTKDRIRNNWIRHLAANTVLELLMMSEWRSKHVEFYYQIKSIKTCISFVSIWSLYVICPGLYCSVTFLSVWKRQFVNKTFV